MAGSLMVSQLACVKIPRMWWVRTVLPALPGVIPFAGGFGRSSAAIIGAVGIGVAPQRKMTRWPLLGSKLFSMRRFNYA